MTTRILAVVIVLLPVLYLALTPIVVALAFRAGHMDYEGWHLHLIAPAEFVYDSVGLYERYCDIWLNP